MTTPRTLVDVFRNLESLGKPDLLLYKKDGRWLPVSSSGFAENVKAVAGAFGTLGIPDGSAVVLLSENRPEWPTIDFACQCYGSVLVPVRRVIQRLGRALLRRCAGGRGHRCAALGAAVGVMRHQQAAVFAEA